MGGAGVIDRFLEVFTRYIDSGFGLLGGEVAFIASTLVVIDMTLAALVWSAGADDEIIAKLVRKTLFVGVFAYLISNWNRLAKIVFESFAGLGLKGSGTGFSSADLLRPGKIAQIGLDAGRPLLESISSLMGYWSFFENFIQIACIFLAWALVLLAFFILAIQLFVTLIEFKLTTLAGFVLIPFGLFGKSAFMAEKVLGNVISSGIKVLVLAVVIGIGSTLFSEFTRGFGGNQPTIDDAMAIVLAALSLLGLGIFGPGIANGLVSGGPQLGAGAAIGTSLAAGGAVMATGAAIGATARGIGGIASGTMMIARRGGESFTGGGAPPSAPVSGSPAPASTPPASTPPAFPASSIRASAPGQGGGRAGPTATSAAASASNTGSASAPDWAKRLNRSRHLSHGVSATSHAIRAGDAHGGGASVNLSQGERS